MLPMKGDFFLDKGCKRLHKGGVEAVMKHLKSYIDLGFEVTIVLNHQFYTAKKVNLDNRPSLEIKSIHTL